jgi:hypothetical protein
LDTIPIEASILGENGAVLLNADGGVSKEEVISWD